MPEFCAAYPGIQLSIGISDRPIALIEESVDCVIRLGQLSDTTMIARTIFQDVAVTCASPAYLKANGTPMTPSELKPGHRLVGYFSAKTGGEWPLRFERDGEHIEVGQVDILTNDSAGQIDMLKNGLGIGQLYRSAVRQYLEHGQLIEVLADWTNAAAPISVLYPQSKVLNARTRLFIDWFSARLRRQHQVLRR